MLQRYLRDCVEFVNDSDSDSNYNVYQFGAPFEEADSQGNAQYGAPVTPALQPQGTLDSVQLYYLNSSCSEGSVNAENRNRRQRTRKDGVKEERRTNKQEGGIKIIPQYFSDRQICEQLVLPINPNEAQRVQQPMTVESQIANCGNVVLSKQADGNVQVQINPQQSEKKRTVNRAVSFNQGRSNSFQLLTKRYLKTDQKKRASLDEQATRGQQQQKSSTPQSGNQAGNGGVKLDKEASRKPPIRSVTLGHDLQRKAQQEVVVSSSLAQIQETNTNRKKDNTPRKQASFRSRTSQRSQNKRKQTPKKQSSFMSFFSWTSQRSQRSQKSQKQEGVKAQNKKLQLAKNHSRSLSQPLAPSNPQPKDGEASEKPRKESYVRVQASFKQAADNNAGTGHQPPSRVQSQPQVAAKKLPAETKPQLTPTNSQTNVQAMVPPRRFPSEVATQRTVSRQSSKNLAQMFDQKQSQVNSFKSAKSTAQQPNKVASKFLSNQKNDQILEGGKTSPQRLSPQSPLAAREFLRKAATFKEPNVQTKPQVQQPAQSFKNRAVRNLIAQFEGGH
eukprot:TRINITY_DN2489_c0_g1_i2.p1 TRINITY_DN2489_c0_g1~~TRINITY_DN2489_c0_g1_i2.p1  ORF type:complete len:558 (-),score=57.27 TRINITY_DN2489_c0_g1_i2:6809-8482(-)